MAQTTDIVLDGVGFMIDVSTSSPGYKRLQDGFPEGLTDRTTITDFYGGGNRMLALERDTFGKSLRVGPAHGGQGIAPWAFRTRIAYGSMPIPTAEKRVPFCIVQDTIYFAIGKNLVKGPNMLRGGAPNYSIVKTYANDIVDICIYQSNGILITFGAAADILFRRVDTGTEVVLLAGSKGYHIEPYAGWALWNDADPATVPIIMRMVRPTGIDFRVVNYEPIYMLTVGAELVVVTKGALYSFTGYVDQMMVNNPAWTPGGTQPAQIPGYKWQGDFKPYFQQGVYTEQDDFKFAVGYGGRIMAWIGGQVMMLTPSGDRAGWQSTGLQGRRCFGGCVAAGYVIVSIESLAGENDLWAWNGAGWWRVATQSMNATDGVWCWPHPVGQTTDDVWNVGIFLSKAAKIDYLRLAESTRPSDGSYLTSLSEAAAYWQSSIIDCGERDKLKAWRRIGCSFHSTELLNEKAATTTAQVYLHFSTDGGDTWTPAGFLNKAGNTLANNNFSIRSDLDGQVSNHILIKVTWTQVRTWQPILTGVWVEHEILDHPARRRKWELRVRASDYTIDRDGKPVTLTGRQQIQNLWSAWVSDAVLTFKDVDYDATPVTRQVRIVGIAEAAVQPYEHGQYGESVINIKLVEV